MHTLGKKLNVSIEKVYADEDNAEVYEMVRDVDRF